MSPSCMSIVTDTSLTVSILKSSVDNHSSVIKHLFYALCWFRKGFGCSHENNILSQWQEMHWKAFDCAFPHNSESES